MKSRRTISISIVEDNTRLREDLALLLERCDEFRVVATYESAETALAKLGEEIPAVVLMDLNLPGLSGMECTACIKARWPAVQVLVLTVYEDTDAIFGALEAGASGYLLKRTHPKELMRAIQEVYDGGVPMTGQIARKVIASFKKTPATPAVDESLNVSALTPREQETLSLLAQGFSARDVADQMLVTVHTVRAHLKSIYEKFQVRSRTAAIVKWLGGKPVA